jgi:hypothetical protein
MAGCAAAVEAGCVGTDAVSLEEGQN